MQAKKTQLEGPLGRGSLWGFPVGFPGEGALKGLVHQRLSFRLQVAPSSHGAARAGEEHPALRTSERTPSPSSGVRVWEGLSVCGRGCKCVGGAVSGRESAGDRQWTDCGPA